MPPLAVLSWSSAVTGAVLWLCQCEIVSADLLFIYLLLLITRQSAQLICLGCKIIQSACNYIIIASYLQFNLRITNYIQVLSTNNQ